MASQRLVPRQGKALQAELITSRQNPRFKFLRSLHKRKYRQREGRFLVEGIRIVEEALERGGDLDVLVYAPELLVSPRARALADRVAPEHRWALSSDLFRTISLRDQPQGVAAVMRIEETPLDAIPMADDMLVLIAYQLRDPGNLGSIIRSASAAGASGLVVVAPSVDLYDPQTVRATMGSMFVLPIVRLPDPAELDAWYARVRAQGFPLLVVASSAQAVHVYFDLDLSGPLALLVGSERRGLPQSVRDGADLQARLPVSGRATSLNASAAAAALLYEIVRQRRHRTG
jgi:TrmH family RNA methyltransferase